MHALILELLQWYTIIKPFSVLKFIFTLRYFSAEMLYNKDFTILFLQLITPNADLCAYPQ